MGWGSGRVWLSLYGVYINAGYLVSDRCWEPGCRAEIDRGVDYLCGEYHGGDEHGCGGYFCSEHLYFPLPSKTGAPVSESYGYQRCQHCLDILHGEEKSPRPLPAHVLTGIER